MIGAGCYFIILLVLIIVGAIFHEDIFDKEVLHIFFILTALAWVIIGVVVLISVLIPSYYEVKEEDYLLERNDLKSLIVKSESQYSFNGAFVLGFGGVSGGSSSLQYYYTIVDYPERGMKFEKYDVEKTYLREEEVDSPYVETIFTKKVSEYKKGWFIGGLFKAPNFTDTYLARHILHVPVGSIRVEYDVDLNKFK